MRGTSKILGTSGAGGRLLLAASLALLLLAGCGKHQPAEQAAASAGVEAATAKSNQQFAQTLKLSDQQDFEDVARGLIARPSGKVLDADGSVIWDYDASPSSRATRRRASNPSLWRQAKLNG